MERSQKRVLESVSFGLNSVLVDLEELRMDCTQEPEEFNQIEARLNSIMRKVSLANVDISALSKV